MDLGTIISIIIGFISVALVIYFGRREVIHRRRDREEREKEVAYYCLILQVPAIICHNIL